MASDCSCTGAAEMVVRKATNTNSSFVSEKSPACQRMLNIVIPGATVLKDATQRIFAHGDMVGRKVDDTIFRHKVDEDNLDLYIAGAMCSPWSGMGKRRGFLSPAARPLIASMESIVQLQPRAVILENVMNLINQYNIKTLRNTLGNLTGYTYDFFQLKTQYL